MTDPLTPPECDLRDFAYMPLDAARLLDSDLFALSTGDEFKAALALWCKAWQQVPAGSLPDDDRVLAHLSGAGSKWRKVKDLALRGFVKCSDGRLYHPVVSEKAIEAWGKKQSFRERSKKGNEKRWGSHKDGDKQSLKDPLAIPEGLLELPKGEGEGSNSVDKSTADSDKVFWINAKSYLKPFVKGDPGSLIGKWSKDHGKPATAEAITRAQLDRAVNPIEFVQGYFRKQATNGYGVEHSGVPL